jgi:ABC-2 type transport system permease protein
VNRLIRWWNNPVLAKEYQWRMRAKKTPWVILLYLAVMGGIILTILALFRHEGNWVDPEQSQLLFTGLAVVQILMISLVAPGLTAGLISGERERQTMSVLLTTRLASSQIIFGKWFASLSFVLLLLFASSPLYIMVFLFGGVSTDVLWKVFAHLLITVLFLGSLGIFYSTLFKRTGVATVTAYLTVALIGIGLLIAIWLIMLFVSQTNPGVAQPYPPLSVEILGGLHPVLSLLFALHEDFIPIVGAKLRFNLFHFYLIAYGSLSVLLLTASVYLLSPVRFRFWKPWKSRKQKAQSGEVS